MVAAGAIGGMLFAILGCKKKTCHLKFRSELEIAMLTDSVAATLGLVAAIIP